MTDVAITPANVLAGAGATLEHGTAGEAIAQGKVVYRAEADKRYKLADNNSATAEARVPRGIALNSAATGQPLTILKAGPLTIGGTVVANTAYYLGDTPGGICPVADLTPGAGEYVALVGMATSTGAIDVQFQVPGGTA